MRAIHSSTPLILIALCALLWMAACAHGGPIPVVERENLHERQASFLAALSARDADRASAFFADDAVLHVAGMPAIRGREAIEQFYAGVFRFLTATTHEPELLRVSAAGEMGYGHGRVANVFSGQDGPVEYQGKYVLIWERGSGEWWIVTYGVSGNQPETPR